MKTQKRSLTLWLESDTYRRLEQLAALCGPEVTVREFLASDVIAPLMRAPEDRRRLVLLSIPERTLDAFREFFREDDDDWRVYHAMEAAVQYQGEEFARATKAAATELANNQDGSAGSS